MTTIYHLARQFAWDDAQKNGIYEGTPEDRADGYMHFSTAAQIAVSAAKHRTGETGLVLIGLDDAKLGIALKWEVSRDDALFPHLYGSLQVSDVSLAVDLPLGDDGLHIFPELD